MPPQLIARISRWSLLAALIALPSVCYLAAQVRVGTAYVEAWLPADSAVRQSYREFVEDFGPDQYLLVSWPDCNLQDPRLRSFSDSLRELALLQPDAAILAVQDSLTAVESLAAMHGNMSPVDAAQTLRGLALGPQGTAFISLQLGAASLHSREELITAIESLAVEEGVASDALILAGEPYQVHVIDQSSRAAMQYYVAPSSMLALGLAWLCLRSARLTLLVFSLAGIGQVIGLALISFFLGEMSAVMVVLPTLVFMLTLSAAIHLVNYYRDAGGLSVALAGARAVQLGAWPCGLATLTTVFGFASLIVSQLSPVWQFGALAALGLLASTGLLLSVFPAATELAAAGFRARSAAGVVQPRHGQAKFDPDAALQVSRVPSQPQWPLMLARLTERWTWPICILGVLLLALSAAGITRLRTFHRVR